MSDRVDVLVVGARCAGSPLALRLARAGKNVLLIDSAELPSDQPMSTHFIQPYGMSILDELGLGDNVREVAPPLYRFVNGIGDAVATIEFPPGQGGSCPRRTDLDAILLDGARAAGVHVETRTRLVELLRDGERVVGGVLEARGVSREVRADITVGADGPHSTVAKLVGAEEYHGYDGDRCVYWAYWPRPADYETSAPYQGATAIVHEGDDIYFIFPTNRDQLLMGLAFTADRLSEWRGKQRETLLERLRAHPYTAPLVEGEPLSKVLGMVKIRFFFRQAAGPGWALVGDAGLFKDPTAGLGISDALRDSKALASAILEGGDVALERYWRQRDVESLELFEFSRDLGTPGYDNPLNRLLFRKIAREPELRQRMVKIVNRELSPFGAFTTGEVVRWTLGALLRGQFGVLKPFFAAGQKAARAKRELEHRKRLRDTVSRALLAADATASAN